MSRFRLLAVAGAVLLAGAVAPAARGDTPPQVHIAGNQFVDGAGTAFRLMGTGAGIGSAGACVEPTYGDPYRLKPKSVFYTPADDHQLDLMRSWHMNTVRISINESCWLGLAPVRQLKDRIVVVSGAKGREVARKLRAAYRRAIVDLVRRAHAKGFVTIVDLHYTAPGTSLAYGQWPLPDADHAPAAWRSLVASFKGDRSMVFEVFNEPYGEGATWACLRDGCTLPNSCQECDGPTTGCPVSTCPDRDHPRGTYRTAGIQKLVDVIRKAGAKQPLITPGLGYSGDLSQWLAYKPKDPLNQLGAVFHLYGDHRYANGCDTQACWDRELAPIAARVPIATTELGQFDCAHDVMDAFQTWAFFRRVSILAFGWYVADFPPCSTSAGAEPSTPAMLLDYEGTPSPMGEGFKAHLAKLHDLGELP